MRALNKCIYNLRRRNTILLYIYKCIQIIKKITFRTHRVIDSILCYIYGIFPLYNLILVQKMNLYTGLLLNLTISENLSLTFLITSIPFKTQYLLLLFTELINFFSRNFAIQTTTIIQFKNI